jgi:hypothetical protein
MDVKEKRHADYEKGKIVEQRFNDLLFKLGGFNVKESSREEDRLEGWDLEITNISINNTYPDLINKKIDVKGIKGGEYNWVEIVGYTSNEQKLGWLLRGLADYIALERNEEYGNDFVIIKKEDIKKFIFNKIPLLKEYHNYALECSNGDYKRYEMFFMLKIASCWDEFEFVEDKEDSLYEKVYSRSQYDHKPDMITRIKNSDLEELAIYKINK